MNKITIELTDEQTGFLLALVRSNTHKLQGQDFSQDLKGIENAVQFNNRLAKKLAKAKTS